MVVYQVIKEGETNYKNSYAKKKKKTKKTKNVTKTKKNKTTKSVKENNFVLHTPIICICNNDKSKNINELKKISEYIKFNLPSKEQLIEYAKKICKLENLILKSYHYKYIINHSQNDFRRILTILESLHSKYKHEPKIKKKWVKEIINQLEKNLDLSVNKCVQKILYNETNLQDIITYANSEPFQIPLVLHENLPNYFQNNLLNKDENNCDLSIQKLQSLSKYYDTMIDYCKLEKLIFKKSILGIY